MGHTHKYHLVLRLLVLFFLVIAICQFAGQRQGCATIVLSLTLEDLVQQADLIVLGSCEETSSTWDAEKKRIFTHVTIISEQCLKASNCLPRINIRQLGGRVNNFSMKVTGAPEFQKGERVILFLKRSPTTFYQVLGMSQGKFSIIRKGGTYYVTRNLTGITLVKKGGGGFQVDHRNELEGELNMHKFISRVESYIRK